MIRSRWTLGFLQAVDVVVDQFSDSGRPLGTFEGRVEVPVPPGNGDRRTCRFELGISVDGVRRNFNVEVPLTPLVENVDQRWPHRNDRAPLITVKWPVQSPISVKVIDVGGYEEPIRAITKREPSSARDVELHVNSLRTR